MADLSDVTAYLAQTVSTAVYPNGIGRPSVTGIACRVYEGWPLPANLDADLAAGTANVSIYPMMGTGITVHQILDQTYTIVPPAYGMSVSVSGDIITVSGQPLAGEYLTLLCDDAFVYSRTGASTTALLAALATDAQANFPAAASTATTITVPVEFDLVVRQGATATMGKVTHRQRQSIMVTIWAPTPASRSSLTAAIDNSLKQTIIAKMTDTSDALITYNRTNVIDELQRATIYRRDLIFDVEYATVYQFPGYVVTSANISIAKPDNTAVATALTAGDTMLGPSLDFSQPANSQFIPLV